ncbi:Diphthamide biosynthesis protein 3 [Polyrhizophydium stewartii]|uniref:Diphthamide biosynthesis protein 3 n=1 Tax=Polyrhizophydium stewartii TaxID=2732419 RepID=A0ABR4MZU8_9FUNG|nr:Diphthamide biosynthesis protein 3 [Polyrhizophydium stewartii]
MVANEPSPTFLHISRRRAGRSKEPRGMTSFYDEVEIEDMDYDEDTETYSYPCPCGDRFQITKADLASGDEVATCPSCSLIIRVIYDPEAFECEGETIDL